jgi:hypothetical protein
MRVARVIAVLEPGGAQLGALRLSLALRAHGIESRWLAGHATREGLALFGAHGVDVEVLGGGRALQYARRRAFAERLAAALGDEDVVHAHMFGAWWAAARAVPDGMPLAASEQTRCSGPAAHRRARCARRLRVSNCSLPMARRRAGRSSPRASRSSACESGAPRSQTRRWRGCAACRRRGSSSPAGCIPRRAWICCSTRSRGCRGRRPRSCSAPA